MSVPPPADEDEDAVLCPPDRSIPIPYLPFKQALQREVSSNNAPQQQQQQFADVFHLLEVLSHARYSSDARYLQSAMALVQPQLSETDRHLLAPTHGDNDTAAAEEQQLLSSIIRLLLEARYTPLTDEEWRIAQDSNFTFDIPVSINWKSLDDHLFQTFWQQQQQQQQQQPQLDGGSGMDTQLQPDSLPPFKDRILVFHRGVGVATAPGLYLSQKLDMLVDYLLVAPVVGLIDSITSSAKSQINHLQQLVQQPQQQDEQSSTRSNNTSNNTSRSSSSRQYSLASAGDLDHPAARVVVRRSIRSLMPGARQVLQRFWEPLVLQEPTYRSVVVLYRAATDSASPASASSSTTAADAAASSSSPPPAAESAVTAAVLAGAGDLLGGADAMMQVAHSAAAEASAAASTAIRAASKSLTPGPLKGYRRAKQVARLQENPRNLIIKSFADVAAADLELVMPSKQVQVQAITLVRSTLAALGALGALVALLQQADAVHWGPSLVFLPAFGLLAGRSIKVLTTIKSHQAALTSTMLSMAYTAARDSQEGVICKLVDELRDADTKEAALALTVMLTGCWEREGTGAGGNGGRGHGSSSSRAFSIAEVDAACEAFLERHFGLQVDFPTQRALALLQQWGVIQQADGAADRFSVVSLNEAVEQLHSAALQHLSSTMQSSGLSPAAAYESSPQLVSPPPPPHLARVGRLNAVGTAGAQQRQWQQQQLGCASSPGSISSRRVRQWQASSGCRVSSVASAAAASSGRYACRPPVSVRLV